MLDKITKITLINNKRKPYGTLKRKRNEKTNIIGDVNRLNYSTRLTGMIVLVIYLLTFMFKIEPKNLYEQQKKVISSLFSMLYYSISSSSFGNNLYMCETQHVLIVFSLFLFKPILFFSRIVSLIVCSSCINCTYTHQPFL